MKKDLNRIITYTVVLAVLTAIFRLFNLDMAIQRLLFDFSNNSWKYADNSLVVWMYRYGTFPAILLAGAMVVVFTMGFVYEGIKKHRKAALLIILTMFIGPGLVANIVLKNYTGRPRPRDVKEFNGSMDFKQPLDFGVPGKGFSFPCGHCTMGFFFYAAYIILRKKNKSASYAVLSGSLIYGLAMGLGRMAQGGHFASDVIWAAGIMVITPEALDAFVIKTDQQGSILDKIQVKNKAAAYMAAAALLIITSAIFIMATPFNRKSVYEIGYYQNAEIISNKADITVECAPLGSIRFQAAGFGLPWSDYDECIKTGGELIYMASSQGFFSELNSSINAVFTNGYQRSITITSEDGNISYKGGNICAGVYLNSGKGDIEFNPKENTEIQHLVINSGGKDVILKLNKSLKLSDGAVIDIQAPKGNVLIQNSSAYFQDMNKSALKLSGAKELIIKNLVNGEPQLKAAAKNIKIEVITQ